MLSSAPASFSSPSLEVRCQPIQTVLRFTGCTALDESNGPIVAQHLSQLPDTVTDDCLVLDLAGIRYVTSTALGALVAFNRRVRSCGGNLALTNVSPFVQEALAVTRLDQLLKVLQCESSGSQASRLPA